METLLEQLEDLATELIENGTYGLSDKKTVLKIQDVCREIAPLILSE